MFDTNPAELETQLTTPKVTNAVTPTPTPDGKPWYLSKTIWFNALFIIASILTAAVPTLEQQISAELYAVLATGVAFINALLRLVTGQPINKGRG